MAGLEGARGGGGLPAAAVGAASGERNPMPAEGRLSARGSGDLRACCVVCCQVEFGEQLLRRKGRRVKTPPAPTSLHVKYALRLAEPQVNHLLVGGEKYRGRGEAVRANAEVETKGIAPEQGNSAVMRMRFWRKIRPR